MDIVHERGEGGSRVGPAVPPPPPDSDAAPVSDGRRAHYAAAGVIFLIGVAAIIGATDLGYWDRGPGPGFFPLWMGVLLSALSLIWAVQTRRATTVPRQQAAPDGGVRQILQTLAGLGTLILLLNPIGYQLAMFLFVLYVLLMVTRRRLLEALVFAVVAGPGVYALFANVLQVYLPTATVSFLTQLGL